MLTAALFVYSHVLWRVLFVVVVAGVAAHTRHLRWQHYTLGVRTWMGKFDPAQPPTGHLHFIRVPCEGGVFDEIVCEVIWLE